MGQRHCSWIKTAEQAGSCQIHHMGNQRIECRALFGCVNSCHGLAIGRVCAEPVNSLSWKSDQTASLKDGGRIRERLLGLSDYDMSCTYAILDSPMGVENYVATLRLIPVTDGNATFAEWTAEFDAAPERESDLVRSIGQAVFQAAFTALKSRFGR